MMPQAKSRVQFSFGPKATLVVFRQDGHSTECGVWTPPAHEAPADAIRRAPGRVAKSHAGEAAAASVDAGFILRAFPDGRLHRNGYADVGAESR